MKNVSGVTLPILMILVDHTQDVTPYIPGVHQRNHGQVHLGIWCPVSKMLSLIYATKYWGWEESLLSPEHEIRHSALWWPVTRRNQRNVSGKSMVGMSLWSRKWPGRTEPISITNEDYFPLSRMSNTLDKLTRAKNKELLYWQRPAATYQTNWISFKTHRESRNRII
jgi:hypothetical protein